MLTRMTENDWTITLEAFRAACSRRGDKERGDRRFLEALHYFAVHKRVKGRKRHILVDTLGLPIANGVGSAGVSDPRAGARLLAGLRPLFPAIRTVMADLAGSAGMTRRAEGHRISWRCGADRINVAQLVSETEVCDTSQQPYWLTRSLGKMETSSDRSAPVSTQSGS